MLTISLDELIETLEPFAKDTPSMPVVFDTWPSISPQVTRHTLDDGSAATESPFESWRGDYAQLSLDPTRPGHREPEPMNAIQFYDHARTALGSGRFPGYKGGTYEPRASTRVYADPWGECPGRVILGVCVDREQGEKRLVIKTVLVS